MLSHRLHTTLLSCRGRYTRSKAAELKNQNELLQQQNVEFREAQRSIDNLTKELSSSNRDNRALTIQVRGSPLASSS